jgi:peptide/nickel transport system substrate-binding protein
MKKLAYFLIIIVLVAGPFYELDIAFGESSTKTLKIGMKGTIRGWDPQRTTGHWEPEIKNAIFDRLITTKPGTWELMPSLAKSWEFSKDRKEITFYLKEGVQFQQGMGELTAEDVKYCFERTLNSKWGVTAHFDALDHVDVIDKYTVKVYLKYPQASFLSYQIAKGGAARIVPKAVKWEPMEKVVLKRFEGYHGEAPYFDKIEYIIFPQQEMLELALEKGTVDLGVIDYKSFQRFKKLKGIEIYTGPRASYSWIGFSVRKENVKDVRVRKAIRHAIDVEEILAGAFENLPMRSNSMLPPQLPGYWKDAPVYKPNLKKAKELLSEAGYAKGLTLSMVVCPPNRGDLVLPIVIEQLSKVGVKINPTMVTRPAMTTELKAERYDMYYIEMTGYAKDPFEASRWFICQQAKPKGWNLSKWCNNEFDELRNKANSFFDPEKRIPLFVKMQKIMDKESPHIWVHHGLTAIGYRDYIDLGKVNPDGRLTLSTAKRK